MATYSNIKKIPYAYNKEDIVFLKQYMLVDSDDNKYLLLDLFNNYSDVLKSISLEISQFNSKNDVIEISTFNYEDCSVKYKKDFVPYNKIIVRQECDSIKVNITHVVFENAIYDKGNIIKIEKEAEETENKKQTKKKKNVVNSDFIKRSLDIKNIFRTIFIVTLLVLTLVGSAFYFNARMLNERDAIKELEDDSFHYKTASRYELIIDKCKVNDKTITIPEKKYDYKIVGLADELFRDSSVENVIIKAKKVRIGNHAFSGCTNLSSIYAEDISDIGEYAFYGCSQLKDFRAVNVSSVGASAFENCTKLTSFEYSNVEYIGESAFNNCSALTSLRTPKAKIGQSLEGVTNIEELYYGETECMTVGNMFGLTNAEVPSSLKKINSSQSVVHADFFKNLNNIIEIKLLNPKAIVDYNAFEGCRSLADKETTAYYEKLNGVILSYKLDEHVTEFTLDESFHNMMENAFLAKGDAENNVRNLTIDSGVLVTNTLLKSFSNLNKVIITDKNTVEEHAFCDCPNLFDITMPLTGNHMSDYVDSDKTYNLISIANGETLPSEYFKNVSVKEIRIPSTVNKINNNALRGVLNLESVTLPNNNQRYSDYNFPLTIKNVTIIRGTSDTISSSYFNNNANLYSISIYGIPNIKKNFVNSCANLNSVYLSNDVQNVELPAIGKNCNSLKRVSVPFIGTNVTTPTVYEQFNNSYASTKEIAINNRNAIIDKILNHSALNITSLKLNGQIKDALGALSNFTSLKTLELGNVYGSNLGYLFGYSGVPENQGTYIPKTLKTVKINSAVISGNYLKDISTIENIYLLDGAVVNEPIFGGCAHLKNLYIDDSVLVDDMASFLAPLPYLASSNTINLITNGANRFNVSLVNVNVFEDVDYNNYEYIIEYKNVEYHYKDIIIDDINNCLERIVNDYNAFAGAYINKGYSQYIDNGYFNKEYNRLYARDESSINLSLYMSDLIFINMYSDGILIKSQELVEGTQFEYYIPTKENYIFDGWYSNMLTKGEAYDFSSEIKEDVDLYAKWVYIGPDFNTISEDTTINQEIEGSREQVYAYYSPLKQVAILDVYPTVKVKCKIYTADGTEIVSNVSTSKFKLSCDMEANTLYYISISGVDAGSYGTVKVNAAFSGQIMIGSAYMTNYKLETNVRVISKQQFLLPIPVKEGFRFVGWYTDRDGKGIQVTNSQGNSIIDIYNDYDLYAYFEKI